MNTSSRTTRRRLLTATAATAVGAGLGLSPAIARADDSTSAGLDAMRFAMVTDTHINAAHPERTADLTRVLAHINTQDPAFVLNCGDVTDYGVADEFDLYRSCIPDALVDRLHEVPGNHEEQWNADALALYRKDFGPSRYSFDGAGLHVIAMDPLMSQEWAWRFGDDLLEFIEQDLRSVHHDTPVIMFNHFPLGIGGYQYVQDGDEFARLIEPFPVRGVFAGHTHALGVSQWNGLTQVVGNGVIHGPIYYWAERKVGDDGAYLEVSEVTVPANAAITRRVVSTMPLSSPGPGGDQGPFQTKTSVGRDSLSIRVDLPPGAPVAHTYAHLHPQGGSVPAWTPLQQEGRRWTGELDISALPPGEHRVVLRAGRGDGVTFDDTATFAIPPTAARVAWSQLLPERINGDVAAHQDLVVVGSVHGEIAAFHATRRSAQPRWRKNLHGIYKGPVFTPDGKLVLVGSTNGNLYALDAGSGRTAWRTDLGAPVLCGIAVVQVGAEHRVVVAAGSTLFCLDLSGRIRWRASLGGVFTGSAASDGRLVFAASGDGNAYAFDAKTGERVWTVSCTDQDTPYGRIIYGPWAARIRLLGADWILVTTFTSAMALDASSGTLVWRFDTLHRGLYTPPTLTDYGLLVFDGKNGTSHLLDTDTGTSLWTDKTLNRSFGTAPTATSDPSVYWMLGNAGTLVRYDLAKRTVTAVLQVSTAFTTSTAALVEEDLLVTASKDGRLHGIVGLANNG